MWRMWERKLYPCLSLPSKDEVSILFYLNKYMQSGREKCTRTARLLNKVFDLSRLKVFVGKKIIVTQILKFAGENTENIVFKCSFC